VLNRSLPHRDFGQETPFVGSSNHVKRALSIGVLSYNQAEELKQTLESIEGMLSHSALLKNNIEVIVSDNGSDDGSAQLILEFNVASKKLFQENNLGFHGNLIHVLENMDCDLGIVVGCGETFNTENIEYFVNWILANAAIVNNPNLISGRSAWVSQESSNEKDEKIVLRKTGSWVDPAIAFNIWKPKLLSSIDFRDINRVWTHYDLILRLKSSNVESMYLQCSLNLVNLDQPESGWYSSPNFLEIILELQDLIFHSDVYDKEISKATAKLSQQYLEVGSMIVYNRSSN
jgi:glycosyltransferase involved in cell wall biosynthesis